MHDGQGGQADILLAKLRPKQLIELEAHCTKGEWPIGFDTGECACRSSACACARVYPRPLVSVAPSALDHAQTLHMQHQPPSAESCEGSNMIMSAA